MRTNESRCVNDIVGATSVTATVATSCSVYIYIYYTLATTHDWIQLFNEDKVEEK